MRERELKLGAGPGFHLPDFSDLVDGVGAGSAEQLRLETVYYDTPDLRLARWGCSLRHRAKEGWTVKLPSDSSGPLLVRGEFEFAGKPTQPPAGAVGLLRAYVRHSPLEPKARLSTLRERVRLTDRTGARLVEIVDDEVSVLDGRRVAARFRELEVEVGEGGDFLLDAIVERLKAAGAGTADQTPKYVRALGPMALAAPEVQARILGDAPSAAEAIQYAIASSIATLLRHDPGIRIGGDPESVHQARVATRRLRSNLRTFRSLLDPRWRDAIGLELGWLGAELGEVRDTEVLLGRLSGRLLELPEPDRKPAAALIGRLGEELERGRARLHLAIESERYIDLLENLVAAATTPPVLEEAARPAAELLPGLASKPWRQLRDAAGALEPEPPDEQLHDLRIKAKRARYAAEAVGPQAVRFAKAVTRLQTILGEHQDSVTAGAWLRQNAGSGRRAFAAGELAAIETREAEKARGEWREAFDALRKKELRDWMK